MLIMSLAPLALAAQAPAEPDMLAVYKHCEFYGTMARMTLGMKRLGRDKEEALATASGDSAMDRALRAIIEDAYTQPSAMPVLAFQKKWEDRCVQSPRAFGFK
jgi:hypothetical protein